MLLPAERCLTFSVFRHIINKVNYMARECDKYGMDRYDALSAADAKNHAVSDARAQVCIDCQRMRIASAPIFKAGRKHAHIAQPRQRHEERGSKPLLEIAL